MPNLKEWSAWELVRVGLRLRSCELWPQLNQKNCTKSQTSGPGKLCKSENIRKCKFNTFLSQYFPSCQEEIYFFKFHCYKFMLNAKIWTRNTENNRPFSNQHGIDNKYVKKNHSWFWIHLQLLLHFYFEFLIYEFNCQIHF